MNTLRLVLVVFGLFTQVGFAAPMDVAINEAGRLVLHQIANYDGFSLVRLTIVPDNAETTTGYVQYTGKQLIEEFASPQDLVRYAAYLQSGIIAREITFGHQVTNDPARLQDIRDRINELAKNFGTNNFARQGVTLADKVLKEKWHLVAATRDFLIEHGSISGEAFQALVAAAQKLQPKMNALVQRGWTLEEAEKIKIDLAPIKAIHEDCENRFHPRGTAFSAVIL
jgi:hypothetical protein